MLGGQCIARCPGPRDLKHGRSAVIHLMSPRRGSVSLDTSVCAPLVDLGSARVSGRIGLELGGRNTARREPRWSGRRLAAAAVGERVGPRAIPEGMNPLVRSPAPLDPPTSACQPTSLALGGQSGGRPPGTLARCLEWRCISAGGRADDRSLRSRSGCGGLLPGPPSWLRPGVLHRI